MAYKVKCTGIEPKGTYQLAFGKRSHKLTAICVPNGKGKFEMGVGEDIHVGKLVDLKQVFGEWAVANYKGTKQDDAAGEDQRPTTKTGAPIRETLAGPDSEDDELSDRERAFFETLSKARGTISEFQRTQCKIILRALLGYRDSSEALKPGETLPKTLGRVRSAPPIPVKRIGPPIYRPKQETHEHTEEPIRQDDQTTESAAGEEAGTVPGGTAAGESA